MLLVASGAASAGIVWTPGVLITAERIDAADVVLFGRRTSLLQRKDMQPSQTVYTIMHVAKGESPSIATVKRTAVGPFLSGSTRCGDDPRRQGQPRPPQVSTKVGRKYCRLRDGDRVVFAELVTDAETMFLATKKARVLHFRIKEAPILNAAGKGVIGLKLEKGDEVLGGALLARPSDCLRVINANDKQLTFGQMKYGITSRGGNGIQTSRRTGFREVLRPPIELVDWSEVEEG